MLTTIELENKLREIKPLLASKYHVSSIGYFGSFARQQQTEKSDLDLLVEFTEPIGWEFFSLEEYLEQSIGIKVDLVTKNALKQQLKESILKQVHYV